MAEPLATAGAPFLNVAAAGDLEGCSRLEVRLRGRDSVEVRAMDGGCGPVRPVLVGAAAFDRVSQTVVLPVAIENGGQQRVKGPASITGAPDSLRVLSPFGLEQNGHTSEYLSYLNPDSVCVGGVYVWGYDSLMSVGVTAGGHSLSRELRIKVKQGVLEFVVVLSARASRASPPVPEVAPDTFPAWIYDDSMFVHLPAIEGITVKDLVLVSFFPAASAAERQAAIDLVDGEVVGGDPTGGAAGGIYFVRLPSEVSGTRMLAAADSLRALPQVEMAALEDDRQQADRREHDPVGAVLQISGCGRTTVPAAPAVVLARALPSSPRAAAEESGWRRRAD